jgi:DNA-3-methyladenine glycosylase II
MTKSFTITPRGPYSLADSAPWRHGHRAEQPFDGVARLAFCVDGYHDQVGVAVRQDERGVVHGTVQGNTTATTVRDQVARILSLDHDANAFAAAVRRDAALASLHRQAPGLRPVLFASPYEAAVWSILTVRRARAQATVLWDRLGRTHGQVFTVAGAEQAALPTPDALIAVKSLPSLPERWLRWLRDVARAALEGQLDADTLARTDPDEAMAALRRIPGIGPFYATLILSASTGATDVLMVDRPGALDQAAKLYGHPVTREEYQDRAEAWRPWRGWAAVLIRATLSEN